MVGVTVKLTRLRRRHRVQIVLVHGLFSNAGFWLPYLEQLGAFAVSLPGIDYEAVLRGGMPLEALARDIESLLGPEPAHLVCHSFGCVTGLAFTRPWLSRTFICPTFAASRFDDHAFSADIAARTGVEPELASLLVEQAIARKSSILPDPGWRIRDLVCLPEDDPYFDYTAPAHRVACLRYRGGHFDVAAPMCELVDRIGGGD